MSEVRAHGPIFDGRAEEVAREFARAAQDQIAEDGARMVREALHGTLRHPTGYYESHVRAERGRIDDDGVIYGPWLEGVGSRNSPKTRFPGYHTFRRTTQAIQRRAVEIAEGVLPPYLRRMQ